MIALILFLLGSNFYGLPYVRAEAESPGGTPSQVIETIAEDTSSNGVNVSTLSANGIGVTVAENTYGKWQYYDVNVNLWYSIAPEAGKVAVLGGNAKIRFVPNKDWNGTAAISYRPLKAAVPGNYVDSQQTYNENDFGVEESALTEVTPVNDAPYITEAGSNDYLGFDGSSYVTFPDMKIYTNSFTVESWVNASSAPTWARIFDTSYGPDNFNIHLAFTGTAGTISFEAIPQKGSPRAKDYIVTTTEKLPLNKWVHVAGVYNAAQKKAYIYFNGVLKGSATMDLTNMVNASAQNSNTERPYNFIGESTWTQDLNYTGGIRDFRLWSKAKTQAEIESQMNTSLTGAETGLVTNYKFNNRDNGGIAVDSSLYNRPGVIYSGTWLSSQGFNSGVVTAVNTPASKAFHLTDVDKDALSVTATSSNSSVVTSANISFSGTGSDREIVLNPQPNAIGSSIISVTVTDGITSTTSSFEFKVVAGQYDLKSITPAIGVMEPAFNRNNAFNRIHVPNKSGGTPNTSLDIQVAAVNPDQVNVTAYADSGSGLTVTGAYPTFKVSGLTAGSYKTVKIKVADKVNGNAKEYQLDIIRYPENDANLTAGNGLALSIPGSRQAVALSPNYSSNTTNYTAAVETDVSEVQVDVMKNSPFATVTLNGAAIGSADSAAASGNVSLNYGKNLITVTVAAEDGKASKTYTISVVRKASSDASLTNLTASPAGLTPEFNVNQTIYTLKVANTVTSAAFTPTSAAGASIKVNGVPHSSGEAFNAGNLATGNNAFVIEVTAQDGVTKKVYSLTIVRAPSDVADLQALTVSAGTLSPAFNRNTTVYSVEVANDVTFMGIRPVLLDNTSSLTVNGSSHESNTVYAQNLKVGLNTVKIVVTSQSGAREKTTILSIIRKASSNANLSALTLSGGVVEPVFNKNQTQYSITVAHDVSLTDITPTLEDPQATLSINGNRTDNAEPRTVNLQVGMNSFTFLVQAEDGVTVKQYTVTVVRQASSDADLTSITLSGKPLSGGFDRSTSTYYEYLGNQVTSVNVRATTSDEEATYRINGLESAGGVPVDLAVGPNVVTVITKAADGVTTKEYTVTIYRAASDNANLADLSLVDSEDKPVPIAFSPEITNYRGSVNDEVTSISLSSVVQDASASSSVSVNGVLVEDLSTIPLAPGLNSIEVNVVAQDGSMKVYTVNLVRNPSKDATLSLLRVTPGVLKPEYQADVSDYSVKVSHATDSVHVDIVTNNGTATYTVKKNGATTGVTGNNVSLDEGANIITVEVTAADGITKKTYTVTVNREVLPKDSSLIGLIVSSSRGVEQLDTEFAADDFDYSLTVPYNIDEVQLDAVRSDLAAVLSVNGVAVQNPMSITLAEGNNLIAVKVLAQDGKTESVYRVTITRVPRSSNARLSDISVNAGVLQPAFDPEVLQYKVEVGSNTTSVNLSPVVADAKAEIQITGRNGASLKDLVEGDNVFDIKVIAEDGTVRTYTVNIVRAASPVTSAPQATPPAPTPVTERVTVKVESGELGQGSVVTETVIDRTKEADGTVHDTVALSQEQAKEAVDKIVSSKDSTARIVIPDEKDQVADTRVNVHRAAVATLGNANVNLEIFTDNVRIMIGQSSLDNFTEDLYFRLVPIKDEAERKIVEDRARIERIVREIAADKQIGVVSRPMTIETNMQSRPVTLSLPLRDVQLPSDPAAREAFLADLVIFVEHSDGEKELVKAKVVDYKAGQLGLQFDINKFSTFTILSMEGWEQYLAAQGQAAGQGSGAGAGSSHKSYINGFTDGTFKPSSSITRAQMAAILARNLGYEESAAARSSFPDVKRTHWALGAIEFVKAAGLMMGDEKGAFRPDAPISRGEMAAIAARYKKLDTAASSAGFSDTAAHWAAKEIAAVRAANIINGYEDGTYRPNGSLTRAEAVKIVNRLFGRGPLYGVTASSWPDVPLTHWASGEIEEASRNHNFTEHAGGGETIDLGTPANK
ncbi:hypothetical protein KC345_g8238 [Hortaea werneckii]|nr:hypothetical protein KC345_g8238 [Hortaea werneckii]